MSYTRVIPRDLFNESKLLKCLGQLALLIHDGIGIPEGLLLKHEVDDDTSYLLKGFNIEQADSDGALYCANLELSFGGRLICLRCPYNSKDAYPLIFILDDEEGEVFTYDGYLSSQFILLLKGLNAF